MAQWKIHHDDGFYETQATALWLLRSAADAWASGGGDVLEVHRVTVAVTQVLMFDVRYLPLRREDSFRRAAAESWRSPRMRNKFTAAQVSCAVAEIDDLLTAAADQWKRGDPEDPPTEKTIYAVAAILFRHRLINRPPTPLKAADE